MNFSMVAFCHLRAQVVVKFNYTNTRRGRDERRAVCKYLILCKHIHYHGKYTEINLGVTKNVQGVPNCTY